MNDEKIKVKPKKETKIHEDAYYTKENLYYKREKRKNIFLIIIVFILLIYMWFCFTYHWGYIKESGEKNEKNTVDTSGNITTSENTTNTATSDNLQKSKDEGPYQLNPSNKENKNNQENVNNVQTNTTIEELTEEELKEIKLIQNETKENFNEVENLDIFKNFEYTETKLIYPGLSGQYEFNVENYSRKNILYNLELEEYNPRNVNMKYKLKRNGEFVAGNENQYVLLNELKKTNLRLDSMMGDTYILYWKWEDSVNDMNSTNSIERGEYTLKILGRI